MPLRQELVSLIRALRLQATIRKIVEQPARLNLGFGNVVLQALRLFVIRLVVIISTLTRLSVSGFVIQISGMEIGSSLRRLQCSQVVKQAHFALLPRARL